MLTRARVVRVINKQELSVASWHSYGLSGHAEIRSILAVHRSNGVCLGRPIFHDKVNALCKARAELLR